MFYGGIRKLITKLAAYTVSIDRDKSGTLFNTRGATGTVTFTLPTLTASRAGVWYEFQNVVDQNMGVTAAANKAVCFNNATATSLSAATTGQKIGARIRAEWDGTSWLLLGLGNGITYTVA